MGIVVRAPNHLGDGVMALPALKAIAAMGQTVIQAPPWGRELYRHLPAEVVEPGPMGRCGTAVLFPPSFRVAWHARKARRRVGVAAPFRSWLLTDVIPEAEHRAATYARLARAVGARVDGPPSWDAQGGECDAPDGHIGLNPISVTGAPVEWQGFQALAARSERPVVFYGGPGEQAAVARVAGSFPQDVGLSLADFARQLRRCAVFVSNDSGAAHFARAVGVPTVVVHGSTTAARTGPAGAVPVEGPALDCRPCYQKRCHRALECLVISVEDVERAVEVAIG